VRIFKNMWFDRFAEKERITDGELRDIVSLLEVDQADANLGGGVYKVRLARPGEGKSGGYRIIVFSEVKNTRFSIMRTPRRIAVISTGRSCRFSKNWQRNFLS